jgi:hypothetical protein
MNASEIAAILDAKKSGPGWLAKCPAHDDRHASLWFSDQVNAKNPEGKLRFECFAGCSWQDVRAAIGISHTQTSSPQTVRTVTSAQVIQEDTFIVGIKRNKLKKVWEKASPIKRESIAWKYLVEARHVLNPDQPIPEVMRETVLKYFAEDGKLIGEFPAIVSRLEKADGTLATIHRTYLATDGSGKAPVEKAKKLMSPAIPGDTEGAAIRLFEPEVIGGNKLVLGIAEGIETALAAHQLFGTSVWAAWSAGGIAKFVPPPGLTHLIVFADNDKAGRDSFNALKKELARERPEIAIIQKMPDKPGADWADELIKKLEVA